MAYAAPARHGWQVRQQADGSTIEVQQMGDEFYHFWHTRDGKIAQETADGVFRVTDEPLPTPAQIDARRAEARSKRAPQAVGTVYLPPRGVVIIAGYTDVPVMASSTQAAFDSLMNYPGYAYNGATGSVRDYFIAQSDSQYMPVFDVFGPVTLPRNRAYYGAHSGGKEDANAAQMIVDACQAVDDQVDFSLYDADNNGRVDFVYVIYAGVGENDYDGEEEAVWAHCYSVYDKNCVLDGKRLDYYVCGGEVDGVTLDRAGIGTGCHEFGHLLGMPDYYSTGPSAAYIICEWSAMDYGMYNNDANTPPNYSIFDKQFMGWTTVEELTVDSQANVVLTTNYADGYKMQVGGATYYIENRQKTGWDIGLPGSGMLLWQVKYDQSAWNSNHVNYTNTDPRYSIISAKSGLMTNGNQVWSTDADPFPGSETVTSWTTYEGFALTEIAETDGVVRFKFNGGCSGCETGLEEIQKGHAESTKEIRDGRLVILRNGTYFDAMGKKIQ